jgi:uncharacterized protein YggT (Ycf19 family)
MSIVHAALNIVGILLWIVGMSVPHASTNLTPGISRVSLVRPAGGPAGRRWNWLLAIAALIFGRAFLYNAISGYAGWSPSLRLHLIAPTFRGDHFFRMLTFSTLSFFNALFTFLSALLLLSVLSRKLSGNDFWPRWIRLTLGPLERLPVPAKLAFPFVAMMLAWLGMQWLLPKFGTIPAAISTTVTLQRGSLIAAAGYLDWQFVIVGLLALFVINSYVYLGTGSLWNFVAHTGGVLLRPLQFLPLRLGRIDLAPVIAVAIVIAVARAVPRFLAELHSNLPN